MNKLPAMLIAMLVLSACASAPPEQVLAARARRDTKGCVEKSWLHDGMLTPAQFKYLTAAGLHDYRREYGANPQSGPPDITRIQRRCK